VLRGLGGYSDGQGGFLDFSIPSLSIKMSILGHVVAPFFAGLTDSFDRYGAAYLVEHKAIIYPLFMLVAAAVALVVVPSAVRIARTPYHRDELTGVTDQRVCWIFGGLVIVYFLLVSLMGFSSRYLYFSMTAFAMLLAVALFRTGARVARRETSYVRLAVLVALVGVVYGYSPAWSKARLRRWQMSGEVARSVLSDLESAARSGNGRRIFLLNLPYHIQFGESIYVSELPTNQLLLDHSLLDYLALRGFEPPHSPEIVVLNYIKLTGPPRELSIRSEFTSSTTLTVQVDRGGVPGEYPWAEIPGRRNGETLFRYHGGSRRLQLPPPEGWSNVMTIELMPPAFGDRPPVFYSYDGRGLQQIPTPEQASRSVAVLRAAR
jgi:prepilin signal peptidase PulO-like enzyme (type II secretory pathway)